MGDSQDNHAMPPLQRKPSRDSDCYHQPNPTPVRLTAESNHCDTAGGSCGGLLVEDPESEAAVAARELLAVSGPWRDEPAAARAKLFRWYQRGRLPYYHFRQIPQYMQDNPQILTGYRAGYTYHENWISLCHLHNESMNVWTHLVGSVAFLLIAGAVTVDALRSGTWVKVGDTHDKIVLALFLLSFSFTYGASALFHLHLSHSKHAFTVFGCWDYSGISAGVLGTSSAILQFLFTCEPATRTGWQLAVLFVNALGVVGPAFPFWPTPAFRPKRAALYMVSAIVSMGPIAHFIVRHGFAALPNPHEYAAVPEFVAGLAVCFAGVVLYVKRMPERLSPGLFDYFGHSHQIWHALCIVSALLHAHVILSLMVWKSAGSPPGCRA